MWLEAYKKSCAAVPTVGSCPLWQGLPRPSLSTLLASSGFHTPFSVFRSSSWPSVRGNLVFYLTDPSKSYQKSSHDCPPPQFSGDPSQLPTPLVCTWLMDAAAFPPLGSYFIGSVPKASTSLTSPNLQWVSEIHVYSLSSPEQNSS